MPPLEPPLDRLVLIVEDDPSFRAGLAALVGMHGHATLPVGTVAEALDGLASGPTHLLLDMNLPDGVGTTVLRHVREAHLPVKVAVLSGSGDDALMAEARALRPDALFRKPPDWDALVSWIAA